MRISVPALCRFAGLVGAMMLALALGLGAAPALAGPVKIVAFGDSLVAGFGLAAADTFPVRLEAALKERGHDVTVVDAGVSGDTSTGGLARFDWSMPDDADAVIVELGANDALRGIDSAETEKALDGILARAKERGVAVLIAGMLAPPNMGPDYGEKFNAVYPALAERHGVALYPFFLDGVAADPALNLGDGMHPNAAGVAIIVERMLPAVEKLIDAVPAK